MSRGSRVSWGVRGVARTDADYLPLLVTNAVLGGGYSARLNQEIRIKRGLSYGAGARFAARRATAPVVASAQTDNTSAVQVLDVMETEFRRLGRDGIAPEELTARASSLIGDFGRAVETAEGLSAELSGLAAFGLPLATLQTYVQDITAITPEQVKATAARVYDPAAASVVMVGDAKTFDAALKERRPDARRIRAEELTGDGPKAR